jgi:spore coat protein U domain-containing protein, fimbrial subunit CupE1/2/3/6
MHAGREAMMRHRVIIAIAGLAGALLASDVFAQGPSCTISTTSVNFGNYNVFNGTALDSTGTISYQCNSAAANITVSLSKGLSTTYNPRQMSKGAERLSYNLYRDAARTSIWGDGASGTAVYTRANPPNNNNVNVPIYGRVPAGQDVSAGTFGDTVSATINF